MAGVGSLADTKGRYSRATFVVAGLAAGSIIPLILVGAGVTSKEAGMAYADWPTSGGYVVNPPGWTEREATLFEHGHRLIGWFSGMLVLATALLCWPYGSSRRWMSLATLLAVVVQGVLGGLRVIEISTELAMLHGVWGQFCFCLACVTALLVSRSWVEGEGRIRAVSVRFFRNGCVIAVVSVVLQLGLGAAYRHFDSNHALIAHVLWAVWLVMLLGWLSFWILGQYSQDALFGRLGWVLVALLLTQLLLGGLAFVVVVLSGPWSPFVLWAVPSAHVLVGALMLACVVMTTVSSYHVLQPVTEESRADIAASAPAATPS